MKHMEAHGVGDVLIVDDDVSVRDALAQTCLLHDVNPLPVSSFIEAKDIITAEFRGVVLSDIRMPGRDGFFLLDHARKLDEDLPVILLTGEGDIPMALRAMREGAFDFLEKPCAAADLLAVLGRAMKHRALVLENRRLRAERETGDLADQQIFGVSDQANALRKQVRAAARAGTDTLILGAPGSGMAKVAEIIHALSHRSGHPFVKRAGQGLDRGGLGQAWSEAAGGTLFIDEIEAMPKDGQIILADLLEAGGGACLIAATAHDLAGESESGVVHPDLFYRVSVATVRISPLADRPEDIPVLFRHYVAQAAENAGVAMPEVPQQVIAGLLARDWPGNARALMSEATRFVLGLETGQDAAQPGLVQQMAQMERALIRQALVRAGGKAAAAAEDLGLPRKTMYDKLAKYGLKPEDFRD